MWIKVITEASSVYNKDGAVDHSEETPQANTPSSDNSTTSLTVMYWPMMGRAGAIFRMLEEAGIAYDHESEFSAVAAVSSLFGGESATCAPPIVIDSTTSVSQSTATAKFIGQKVGMVPPTELQIFGDQMVPFFT